MFPEAWLLPGPTSWGTASPLHVPSTIEAVIPKLDIWKPLLFPAIFLMTLTAFAQQPLAASQVITDPIKLESKNVPDMSSFSIEKLYMTRLIGSSTWAADGKQV